MTDLVTLETGALAFRGGAVARDSEGKVVFVRGAAPDELVEARRLQRRSKFDLAEVARVVRPSPHRVEPFCPLAEQCGGCEWQHVALETQRDACHSILTEVLSRAGVTVPPEAVVPSPLDRGWRHRARLHLAPGEGRPLLGFFRPGTHEVLDTPDCPVLAPQLLEGAAALRGLLVGQRITGELELTLSDQGLLLSLRLSERIRDPGPLIEALARTTSFRGGVVSGPGMPRRGFGVETGTKALSALDGVWQIPVAAGAFLQANWAANRRLVEETVTAVTSLLPLGGQVLELYAGSGNLSLPLLDAGLSVEAWETSGAAVRALEAAAGPKGKLEVRRGDAAHALSRASRIPDLVLLDPPRTGARKVCEGLREHGARRAVYVSCDPYTLGRDLGILSGGGWQVERVVPLDLFPHTPHIESVTSLIRR